MSFQSGETAGHILDYIQKSCIEWASQPIMINKNKKVIGIRNVIKLGSKPIHRTKVDDHGNIVCIVPKVLYTKSKCIVKPMVGFKAFVQSTLVD